MGKNFFNRHKKTRNVFTSKILKESRLKNIVDLKNIVGKIPFKKVGKVSVIAGQALQVGGILTGQPELVAAGVGLEVVGEVAQGKSGARLGEAIGQDIGEGLAGGIGSKLGGEVGKAIGKAVIPGEEHAGDDRTHNEQHRTQISENKHLDDKEQHHNSVQLPSDLQAIGGGKSGVGDTLSTKVDELTQQNKNEIAEGFSGVSAVSQLLPFLAENFDKIENLAQSDKDDIFDNILESGLMDDFLRQLQAQA